ANTRFGFIWLRHHIRHVGNIAGLAYLDICMPGCCIAVQIDLVRYICCLDALNHSESIADVIHYRKARQCVELCFAASGKTLFEDEMTQCAQGAERNILIRHRITFVRRLNAEPI
ncbi:hypothetical protein ABQW67_18665, partial [Xanthomonas hortorum]